MNRVDQRCQNKKHVRPRWWPGYPRSILICMRATRSFQAFHFNWLHSHLSNRCCFDSLGFYRFPRRRKPLFSAISWEFSSPGPREEALSHEFPIPVRPNFSEKIRTIFAEREVFPSQKENCSRKLKTLDEIQVSLLLRFVMDSVFFLAGIALFDPRIC